MKNDTRRVNPAEIRSGTLADLHPGQCGIVEKIAGDGVLKRRLSALGIVKGTEIRLEVKAPLGDPRAYSLLGYHLSLRNEDAQKVVMQRID
jgi:ferrous iron transport protein A